MAITKEDYGGSNAWGMSCSVDLHGCNPSKIKDADFIRFYVIELCKLIDMKRFGETVVVNFGEDPKVSGYSMTQLIETSLISGHFADTSNAAYIDIFSCKYYDPEVVAEFTKQQFEAESCELNVILRK